MIKILSFKEAMTGLTMVPKNRKDDDYDLTELKRKLDRIGFDPKYKYNNKRSNENRVDRLLRETPTFR